MSETQETAKNPAERGRRKLIALLPLILFGGLALLFLFRLDDAGNNTKLPSALIDKPVPTFTLPPVEGLLRDGQQVPGLSSDDLKGNGVVVVNVWASWCVPCRAEHPFMMDLAKDSRFRLVGINYKDKPENARRFLGDLGNPFAAAGSDQNGRVGIDWGVYGVPETYIVDDTGTIRFKYVGPLTDDIPAKVFYPALEKVLAGTGGTS